MRYPPEFIDKVQEAASLLDIISQYTQLKPSGAGFMGRCPFPDHQEKTASFSMSEAKQVYHCFGCKKSGNIFTFLRDYNGMNFPEALEYLADRHGIVIPVANDGKQDQYAQSQDVKKQVLKMNKIASDFFKETLKRSSLDSPIKQYISKRKLTPETIEEFHIGYSSSEWDRLSLHLQKNNFSMPLADEAKLVKARKEGQGYFDLFRDRLMFPIISPSGEVLAFGGRIHDQGEPKYLNSPETVVFSKSKVLYGLAQTAKYIRSEDCVIIVEGYMDLVSLYQAGLKNVAASMGTALTAEHAKLIKRMTNNVVVLFDGDEAGQMAAERSLSILLSQGLYPRGLVLVDAKDPDEYVNKFGLAAMNEKIQKSSDLFNVVLQSWMIDYRGEASQKVKLVDRLKPIFDSISDNRLKGLYAEDLMMRMNVTKDWLRSALQASQAGGNNANRQAPSEAQRGQNVQNLQSQNSTAIDTAQGENSTLHIGREVDPNDPFGPLTEKIKISDANQVELMLLQMGLKSRANFEWLLEYSETITKEEFNDNNEVPTHSQIFGFKQIISQINHLGVRKIFEIGEQVYRQGVNKFDKFFTLLIDKIDKPEMLFQNSNLGAAAASPHNQEFDVEKEQKYLFDLIKKIQQNFIKAQSKKMASDIKSDKQGFDVDKLKEFVELQKSRLSLKK
ncbi:MAG: DNA primase [Moraxellaceae bacterium]|nr:DNA primase [Pseudobdellovibrionaceae bacterium]